MHGYELRKRLNLMLGWGRVLSYGSLYPALKKMLRAELIEELAPKSVSRRPRIVYQLTEAGDVEFQRLMSEVGPTAWDDDTFDIRFAFFGRTDMEIRLRVLEGRRSRLQERLERVQKELAMTQQEVDRYAAELQRHGVESVEREVRWLSELINAERTGDQKSTGTTNHRSVAGLTTTDDREGPGRNRSHGCGTSSNRGRGQLRHVADPGRGVLPGRRSVRDRSRADARRLR